jgi:hypothetical protein
MRMKWTTLAAALPVSRTAPPATTLAEPIELQWWHAMTSVNADRVNGPCGDQSLQFLREKPPVAISRSSK